ncbi:putative component of the Rsx system (modular protein) [Gammaproteobacteria bacterium]
MENDDVFEVEVAYARPDFQIIIPVQVPPGSTLQQAVDRSRIQERCPEIDPRVNQAGIFGKISRWDQVLRAGDRVEIYRALFADPKQVRKERAAAGKRMKKGSLDDSVADDAG